MKYELTEHSHARSGEKYFSFTHKSGVKVLTEYIHVGVRRLFILLRRGGHELQSRRQALRHARRRRTLP